MFDGKRRRAAIGLMLLAGPVAAGAQQVPKLTLAEAIARSEKAQPSVVSAFGTVRNAGARQRSASGAFLPNLTLSGSRNDNFSEGQQLDASTGQFVTNGSSTQTLGSTLSSSLDLFAGFRRTGEKRAASANRDAADASYLNTRLQQQLTTTNAFFDVLAAGQLVTVREASVVRAQEQLKVAVARLQAGRGIRPDSLRSLVNLGNAQVQLITARAQLSTAEANLGRLVGADGPVGAVEDSTLYAPLAAVDTVALQREALAGSPSVRSAEAQARSARAAITVAKAGYFPTLSLSGSASLNGSSRNSYTFLQSRAVGLALSFPIFNRFQREQGVVSSQVAADIADATAADARRLVLANLTAALAALEGARLRIAVTQTSVEAGREDLRVQEDRYRFGAGTIVDVLTSREALSQAEVDAVTARFDYVRARAQISALLGRTL
jgi:outer membrane protein